MNPRQQSLIGIARSQSCLSKGYQRVALLAMQRGHLQDVLEATAHAILVSQLLAKTIPQPMGIKTDELCEHAAAAITDLVWDYHLRGGVVTGKGFFQRTDLTEEVLRLWHERFTKPLDPAPTLGEDLGPDGTQQRLTLAAHRILDLLTSVSRLEPARVQEMLGNPGTNVLAIPAKDLEAFCKKAALAVQRAFLEPELVIHEREHGASDDHD